MKWATLRNTAVTKQWTAKWPYIAIAVFQLHKIVVNKVTFLKSRGAIAPLESRKKIGCDRDL